MLVHRKFLGFNAFTSLTPAAFCRKQTSSLDTTLIERFTQSIDAANVNLRKHGSRFLALHSSRLGVTCRSVNPMP
jgi:hypothetical protein